MVENKFLVGSLVIIIVALIAIIGFISLPKELPLPANAQKLSECVPNMGAHFANPQDLPFGPIYLVDKGKVVGIEYMIHEEELEENILNIEGEKVGKAVIMPTLGMKFDHVGLNYLPEGHEGDEEAHYDVHMYLVSEEEQQKLCK